MSHHANLRKLIKDEIKFMGWDQWNPQKFKNWKDHGEYAAEQVRIEDSMPIKEKSRRLSNLQRQGRTRV